MREPILTLTIEFPIFYVGDLPYEFEGAGDEAEQIEDAMQLASENVIVVFTGHEGDSPGTVLRSMEGRIVGYAAARSCPVPDGSET